MASLDPKTKSTYATTDWVHYRQGRPSYPKSLTDIIYTYRRRHPNTCWTRLVDIGAGSGVASTSFLPDFKIIHISDPSSSNTEQSRSFLPNWAEKHGIQDVQFEYSEATGEEAYLKTGEGEADLAICATAAHFIEPDGLVESIARMLRKGGTLAVFSYWMPNFPGRSRKFHDIFSKTWDDLVLKPLQENDGGEDLSNTRLAKVVERRMSGNGVLDSVPLPEELFEDATRVYINARSGKIAMTDLFAKYKPRNISRVKEGEKIVHYETGKDKEAEGWEFEVDGKWLRNFVNTIRPNKIEGDEAEEAFAEWETAIKEECPDGTFKVLWPAYLVLATRK
ncbi:hypothetical protein GQ43DRAFT_438278 [Delitschia confertaspora ATCC 74209]|uniref:Methyltransferase type 11 domain-containing protein n=1 Tax=Delitschia confertaspora ATCC 74209 TaxID=1513339 RepID=A0A9P4JVP1_9PLEO|nr:hypothetical protein GQ43DRAFT_438278 [Delitschia confertaspora ATCC 74209]